jgi:hypothetical protein
MLRAYQPELTAFSAILSFKSVEKIYTLDPVGHAFETRQTISLVKRLIAKGLSILGNNYGIGIAL